MNRFTQILYQVVFTPKCRDRVFTQPNRENLHKYLAGVLRKKNCFVYAINGPSDHVHLLFSLHPSISLAGLVKDLKLSSGAYIYEKKMFSLFNGWQDGYGAFTYAYSAKEDLIRYVQNQIEHHRDVSFYEELRQLLIDNKIDFDERYLI